MPSRILALGLVAFVVLAACSGDASSTTSSAGDSASTTATLSSIERSDLMTTDAVEVPEGPLFTTSGSISGNRVVVGSSNLVDQTPIDIPLGGVPLWVVGVEDAVSPVWVVALEDGTLEAWRLGEAGAEAVALATGSLPGGTPPLVASASGSVAVIVPPADAAPYSHPTRAGDRLVYLTHEGGLVIANGASATELAIDALPDSRLSVSSDGLVSVLAEPTDRYRHGVLGDDIEAGRLITIDPIRGEVVGEAVIPEPSVIEGIAAPWVDVDGDGTEELLVTVSNRDVGARLVVFDRTGELIAEGPPIGRGNRWRNQLGAAPTGPDGEVEVIDVRVPHLGGVVEYFRLDGADLVRVAEQSGFTSHRIGSRNLDMAIAADVTGDGITDTIVPTNELDALGVLSRVPDGVEVVANLQLPGRLTTNLAGAALTDGRVALAVGTSEAILRIYVDDR